MSNSSTVLRISLNEIAGRVANDARRATAVFSSTGLSFAMSVSISRNDAGFTAEVATAAGIGPVERFGGTDQSELVEQIIAVLAPVMDNLSSLTAVLNAEFDDLRYFPAGVIDSTSLQFRVMPEAVADLLSAAVKAAIEQAAVSPSSICVQISGKSWPVWLLFDRSVDGVFACTNDICLLTGSPPRFAKNGNSDVVHAEVLRFLSQECADCQRVDVTIRRAGQPDLIGNSVDCKLEEKPVYDPPV